PLHVAVLAFRIDDVRVVLVDAADEAVAPADELPVLVDRPAEPLGAVWSAPTSVVLQAAVRPVRRAIGDRHVVKLADRAGVAHVIPRGGLVVGDVDPAIGADDQVPAILRVDPQAVLVRVQPAVDPLLGERLAAVGAAGQVDAEDPERVVVGRIDADDGEVERPRVDAVEPGPRSAAVRGLVDAAGLEPVRPLLALDVRLLTAERGLRIGPAGGFAERLVERQLGGLFLLPAGVGDLQLLADLLALDHLQDVPTGPRRL